MSQIFDKVKIGSPKRSTFDLSHDQITTSDFGHLIPVCFRDMVPNDDFVVTPDVFVRLAPLAVPSYGRVICRLHHFFVPYRILYPLWGAFITQDSSNTTVPPFFTVANLKQALALDPAVNSSAGTTIPRGYYSRLMSNLGINPSLIYSDKFPNTERISAFPFLAYYRIWLDYFCDTNIKNHSQLVAAFNDIVAYGGSLSTATQFLASKSCCYKKDYFTTCKLSPQSGNASVVGADLASVSLNPALPDVNSGSALQQINGRNVRNATSTASATSKIAEFTVEALRAASSLQRYLERNNYVGSKLINRLLVHFGVSPTAERLDMSEFLGGSSFPIEIGDVTSHNSIVSEGEDWTTYGLGMQAGKGWGRTDNPESVRYHASEHGVFLSLMSIVPDTSYYQGIPRMFQKGVTGEPLDFYTPEFENLGYQEVLNKEVYVPTSSDSYSDYQPNGIFGYSPRYSEYKFQSDVLGGDFALSPISDVATGSSLDAWHLFRKLKYSNSSPLALNENFVEMKNSLSDYDRIFQYTNNNYDHFYFKIRFDVKATRPMSGFVEPSLDANNEGDGKSVNLPYGGTRL